MIKIVTDSTAYLSEAIVRQHDIRVVPLYVHFGEEAFKEGIDLSDEEFYARLKKAPVLPTTSQPSAGEFHQVFEELNWAGHEIVTLTISSKLSGTWNSAMAAKEMLPEASISVVDTESTARYRDMGNWECGGEKENKRKVERQNAEFREERDFAWGTTWLLL